MPIYFDAEDGNVHAGKNINGSSLSGKSDYHYFKRRLHEEVLRSQRRQHAFTLLRVAVESSFKTPEEMIALIISAVREYDLVCHLQLGDYAVVLPETGEKYAEKIASRIKQTISEHIAEHLTGMRNTRIGIACFPYDGTNTEDLLDSAEQDLCHQPG